MGKYSVGETFTSKYGTAIITEVKGLGKQAVKIRWLDKYGHEQVVKNTNLGNGQVQNPYAPVVHGVGFMGVGVYNSITHKREHTLWKSMFFRAYGEFWNTGQTPYSDVVVASYFHDFQNFAYWCSTQVGFFEPNYQLDKDVLVKGNRAYSPQACRFVPNYVNTILSASASIRGDYPLGVHKIKAVNPYVARIKTSGGESKHLGVYSSPKAAHKAWQIAKTIQIELTVAKYANERVFDTEIADALMARVWNLRLDVVNGMETLTL